HHHHWHIRPQRGKEWDCVDLIDHDVKHLRQFASVAAKGRPVHGPLTAAANNVNAFQRLFGGCPRKDCAEPFDRIALLDKASSDLEGDSLGTPRPWILRATPIKDQDPQVRLLE